MARWNAGVRRPRSAHGSRCHSSPPALPWKAPTRFPLQLSVVYFCNFSIPFSQPFKKDFMKNNQQPGATAGPFAAHSLPKCAALNRGTKRHFSGAWMKFTQLAAAASAGLAIQSGAQAATVIVSADTLWSALAPASGDTIQVVNNKT